MASEINSSTLIEGITSILSIEADILTRLSGGEKGRAYFVKCINNEHTEVYRLDHCTAVPCIINVLFF